MFSFRHGKKEQKFDGRPPVMVAHKRPCLLYVFISELGSFVVLELTGASNGGKNKKYSL
jgi:hypothetical protein